jgi:tRNA pseudouridine38-40 synthase
LRYFISFSYHGRAYHGWQRQPNAITVQGVLEDRMSKLLGQELTLVGAGRTDAGVHARHMVAHFDWETQTDWEQFIYRLNAFLPEDIGVYHIRPVEPGAHARFHASSRTYEYWVSMRKDPFLQDGAYTLRAELDVALMNAAGEQLLKHSDFECFSKAHTDVKTYICAISEAYWRWEGHTLIFTISADRFLRNMVRAVVGTLLEIGKGRWLLQDLEVILASKDRGRAGVSVPAKGLYLTEVAYPSHIYLENEHGH